MKIRKTYLIGAILLMLCLNIAYAVGQYGKLIEVEFTLDPQGFWGTAIVTMEINGVTIYLTMRMITDDYFALKEAKGKMISIYYHWDGNGRRIYDGFKYGNPNGIQNPSTPVPEELKHRHGALNSPIPIDPNW